MRCYEEELKRPLRNLVNGELMRAMLIQVGTELSFILSPFLSCGELKRPLCNLVTGELMRAMLIQVRTVL